MPKLSDLKKWFFHPVSLLLVGLIIGALVGSRAIWYDLYTRIWALGFFRTEGKFPLVVGLCAAFTLLFALLVIITSASDMGNAINTTEAPHADASRSNYLDSLKTMIGASGVTLGIVAAGLQQKIPYAPWVVRRAAVLLTLCMGLSVLTMFLMSQAYDNARTKKRFLNWTEFIPLLICVSIALFTFFLGFSYLARLTFYIQ